MPDTQELLALQRRRKLADALLQGGMDSGPANPMQAIARMVQAYVGQKVGTEADTGLKDYETSMQQDRSRALGEYMTKMQGAPAQEQMGPTPDGSQMPMGAATPPDPRGAMAALLGAKDPTLQQAGLTQMLTQTKPDVFNKIDPKDYTPDSIRAFQASGNDFTKLVPVRKREAVNTGGSTQFVDPFAPPQAIPHTQTPDSVASNAQQRWSHLTPSGSTVFQGSLPQLYEGSTQGPMWLTRPGAGGAGPAAGAPASKAIPVQGPGGAQIPTKGGREDADALRHEFQSLPQVKSYQEVLPVIKAAKNAADTPQGDINLIYAVGKVMDPGSVVREGELNLVIKSGSPAQRLQGLANSVAGGGRLPPAQRKALLAELEQRSSSYRDQYAAARSTYAGIAQKRGYDPNDIFVGIEGNDATQQQFKVLGRE